VRERDQRRAEDDEAQGCGVEQEEEGERDDARRAATATVLLVEAG